MSLDADVAGWARSHQACFESDPLIEMRGTEKVQVGFTLNLYASLPLDSAPGRERQEAIHAVWQQLQVFLRSALDAEAWPARVEVEPLRAAVLRPANELRPEVFLRASVVHDQEAFQAVTPEDRERLSAFEKRLLAMGLKAGRW